VGIFFCFLKEKNDKKLNFFQNMPIFISMEPLTRVWLKKVLSALAWVVLKSGTTFASGGYV
jgi:hypothetical protein